MLELLESLVVGTGRALHAVVITLVMGTICGLAFLFTLAFAAPLKRLKPEPKAAPRRVVRNTRALLRT